jgi:hypothetical protein
MTPSEHLVNVAVRFKMRVDGEKLAIERAQRQIRTAQSELTDCKERLAEAEGEYTAFMELMRCSDDPDLLIAFLSKL